MKFYKYYRLSIITLIIIFMFLGIYVYTDRYMPNQYNLLLNQEQNIDYHIPIEVDISGDIEGVLYVNNEPVPDNKIQIDLNEAINIKSSEEGSYNGVVKLFGLIPIKNIEINTFKDRLYFPCGNTVGIIVNTDGVLVLGTGNIITTDGKKHSPSNGKLMSGDYIKKVNNIEVNTIDELIQVINDGKGEEILVEYERNSEPGQAKIQPISTNNSEYMIGLWIRDDTKGIGTLSYVDNDDYSFGALGHAITDIDTNTTLNIDKGMIVETLITEVNKGEKGNPGEITGVVVEDEDSSYGSIVWNNDEGIYGQLNENGRDALMIDEPIPIGFKYDIKLGQAYIKSDVSGTMEEYEISIEKVYLNNESNKGMLIRVVDQELIDETNGIVQGMSGCPIIQNGKLIGAVTHVFIQDSTKGYGTFIENMILSTHNEN